MSKRVYSGPILLNENDSTFLALTTTYDDFFKSKPYIETKSRDDRVRMIYRTETVEKFSSDY